MIYLIEHGQTALDAAGRAHGTVDAPLDRKGRHQAIALGLRLRQLVPPPVAIYHSDRKRTEQTAKLAGHVARIPVAVAPELRPLDSGALGTGPQQLAARRLVQYFRRPEMVIPGGESVAAWRERHLGFMRRVAAQHPAPVAFVTHSNVIGSVRGGKSLAAGAAGARRAMAQPPPAATPLRAGI